MPPSGTQTPLGSLTPESPPGEVVHAVVTELVHYTTFLCSAMQNSTLQLPSACGINNLLPMQARTHKVLHVLLHLHCCQSV